MIHTIKSIADFDRQLSGAGQKLVVVDFYATWCGPCKSMDPKVRELSKKYSSKAVILKVNVDKFDDIATSYKINSMPTFIFIKNKKKVAGFTGADFLKLGQKMAQYS